MHKLKTLLEIQLIKEALPLHVAKSYVTMGGRRGENPHIEAPLNITNNTSIVLDMTLEDMIRDLKALGLTNLQLYIDVDYLDKLLLANAQSSFAGKFMDSLYAKMKSIPIYEAEYGGRKGSQYYRLLGWISRELPTLQYWTHYQSGASDLRRLPQWAFPENW